MQQFFFECWRLQDSNFNGTGLHQGDFLKNSEQSWKSRLLKVINKEKPPQMFSLSCNLTKNATEFLSIKITTKKVSGKLVDFLTKVITPKKVHVKKVNITTSKIVFKKICGNYVEFSASEIIPNKVRGNDVKICQNLVFDVST